MLVDTGAWYAIADASDRHHQEAREFYTEHAGRTAFVTTALIVAESWALVQSHLGRTAAVTFWAALREARIPVLTVEPVDLEAAWHIAERKELAGPIPFQVIADVNVASRPRMA